MQYKTENIQVSMSLALAAFLVAAGYDVYWQGTGETDSTLVTPVRGTVTLAPEFPADPQFIVRLKGDSSHDEVIVVPALVLRVVNGPRRKTILGVGHKDYEWQRNIVIDGFAFDEFEQRFLADLLFDFLASEETKEFAIYDYSTDSAHPVLLGPLWIEVAGVDRQTLVNEVEAVRWYINATAVSLYVE
jgi:hypothetical protein